LINLAFVLNPRAAAAVAIVAQSDFSMTEKRNETKIAHEVAVQSGVHVHHSSTKLCGHCLQQQLACLALPPLRSMVEIFAVIIKRLSLHFVLKFEREKVVRDDLMGPLYP